MILESSRIFKSHAQLSSLVVISTVGRRRISGFGTFCVPSYTSATGFGLHRGVATSAVASWADTSGHKSAQGSARPVIASDLLTVGQKIGLGTSNLTIFGLASARVWIGFPYAVIVKMWALEDKIEMCALEDRISTYVMDDRTRVVAIDAITGKVRQ